MYGQLVHTLNGFSQLGVWWSSSALLKALGKCVSLCVVISVPFCSRSIVKRLRLSERIRIHCQFKGFFLLCMLLAVSQQHSALSKRAASPSSLSTSCFALPHAESRAFLIQIIFNFSSAFKNSCGQQVTAKAKREISTLALSVSQPTLLCLLYKQVIADEYKSTEGGLNIPVESWEGKTQRPRSHYIIGIMQPRMTHILGECIRNAIKVGKLA